MEDLLTPQICMDVDDTPLDVGKDTSDDSSSESGEPEMGDDEKVKLLLEEKFLDSAQVPKELTDFEKEAKKNVFAIGEPAVQFQRLHCTACNIHLGSAPIGHFNRYIHPLLKVLLCKACYDFYCSGEFDKDEDGSEMYCRWCGQGGKVMCCAQCAYVFCQKCVRQNLGKRTLELIKDSDDWLCFGCNPTQLINLKIICTTLFEFVQEEIRLSKSLNNIERLKVDHSVCCQKIKASKRKRDDDAAYVPHKEWEESKPKKTNILKTTLSKPVITESNAKPKNWNQKDEAEVVCTPDLLSLMEDDPPPLTPMPNSLQPNKSGSVNTTLSKEVSKVPSSTKEPVSLQQKLIRPEGKKLFTIAPKTMIVSNANTPSYIRLQTPAIKFVSSVNRSAPIVNSIPAQITPGTRHEWYDKAATVVSTITGNLSATLMNLTKEQRSAKSVEQLANIHNKLQELLSSSVNSLIQVRKNLRAEFLDDLNKLKFSNANSFRHNNMGSMGKPKVNNSVSKGNDEDDDVIIVNSENNSVKPLSDPPPLIKISSTEAKSNARPYLKVRSVSQLLSVSSECITIPDDPPGSSGVESEDVIALEEKDPLELSPVVPEQSTSRESIKNEETDTAATTTTKDKESAVTPTRDIVQCDENDATEIMNPLTENRIEQIIMENMKYVVKDISQEELKRILSVRVLISRDFGEDLPVNRLKTTECCVEDNVSMPVNEAENENEGDVQKENIDVEFDVSSDNMRCTENVEENGRESATNSLDAEANFEDKQPESNKVPDSGVERESENEESCEPTNGSESLNENDENKSGDEDLNENSENVENRERFSEDNESSSEREEITNANDEGTNLTEENGLNSTNEDKDSDKCDNDNNSISFELESQLSKSDADCVSKSDTISSEQITTDSGVEVNSSK